MNQAERNCAAAVKAYLIAGSAAIAAVPPANWDAESEATLPRLSLKVTQGEEVVYLNGVYGFRVSLETVVRAKKNRCDTLDGPIQALLSDSGALDTELTTISFYCFGRVGGLSRSVESGDGKRHTTIEFELYGFDLDRFSLGGNDEIPIDFGGGVTIDAS